MMKLLYKILPLTPIALALTIKQPGLQPANIYPRQTCSLEPTQPKKFWYEEIKHNGISPFIPEGDSWPVHRNVKGSHGAKGDGLTDDSDALQDAINIGNSLAGRHTKNWGTTTQPAVVYIPSGTYIVSKPLQLYVGTMVIGDPINPPIIKAASGFGGEAMVIAKDSSYGSTDNFFIGIKNVVLTSQSVARDKALNLLDWSVSQATQLSNVVFDMPYDSTGHTGLAMPQNGSPLMINDCSFRGGNVGIALNTQQYHFKGLTFDGCNTGIRILGGFDYVIQGCSFSFCTVGIDTSTTNIGFLAIIDSKANYVDTLVNSAGSTTGADQLVLENVEVTESPSTVNAAGASVLEGGVLAGETWVWGKVYRHDSSEEQAGSKYDTKRPEELKGEDGGYKTIKQPTYREYGVEQFVNVKDVSDHPVAGDGVTDDTASLQHIIDDHAGCKILFFPHGTYLVTDTLHFPPGCRVFGEGWSAISASGEKFGDSANPKPLIRVGDKDDVGTAQFSDMVFTVAEVLPGCKLLEVNMAGERAGDVGFWNTHVRIGGAAGSKVETECQGHAADCRAAHTLVHLTESSSAYVENMWLWTADHDLDGASKQTISTGRGMLVEATKGTWLLGMGIEHNTLYQANIHQASNLFMGFQQSETPYWQGPGNPSFAPHPWDGESSLPSDPDFSWCDEEDGQCRMALYQKISGSKNLSIYGAGFWTFFNNNELCGDNCQGNAVMIEDTEDMNYFGINTRYVHTLVRHNGDTMATSEHNVGGWGAAVAAFLTDSK